MDAKYTREYFLKIHYPQYCKLIWKSSDLSSAFSDFTIFTSQCWIRYGGV